MTILDVGAYLGDFTAELLSRFPESTGLLFEPTPESCAVLESRFQENQSIQVMRLALSAHPKTADFYIGNFPYNNSLRPPVNMSAQKTSIGVETLDRVLDRLAQVKKVDFIKIDAQGNDLQILRGAEQTIRRDSPAIMVEGIMTSLYEQQDSYYDILHFMSCQQYWLAGVFDAHLTESGVLAFADLLFLPSSLHSLLHRGGTRYVCHDSDYLLRQNQILQKACDERLELINRLNKEMANVADSSTARIKRFLKKGLRPWAR